MSSRYDEARHSCCFFAIFASKNAPFCEALVYVLFFLLDLAEIFFFVFFLALEEDFFLSFFFDFSFVSEVESFLDFFLVFLVLSLTSGSSEATGETGEERDKIFLSSSFSFSFCFSLTWWLRMDTTISKKSLGKESALN